MIIADKNQEEAEDRKKNPRKEIAQGGGDIFLNVLQNRKRFVLSEGENNCKSKGQTIDAGKFIKC